MIARAASDAPARSSSLSSLLLSVATMSAMMSRASSRSAGDAAAHFALALWSPREFVIDSRAAARSGSVLAAGSLLRTFCSSSWYP